MKPDSPILKPSKPFALENSNRSREWAEWFSRQTPLPPSDWKFRVKVVPRKDGANARPS